MWFSLFLSYSENDLVRSSYPATSHCLHWLQEWIVYAYRKRVLILTIVRLPCELLLLILLTPSFLFHTMTIETSSEYEFIVEFLPLACIILSVFWPLPTQALLNSCFVRAFHMDFLERPTCPGNEFYYWIDLLYRPKELACCSTTRKEEENDIYNEIEVCSRTNICEKAELTPSTCT